MKDKLKTEESIESDNTVELKNAITEDNKVQEAISALQVLGYSQREIENAMKNVDKDNLGVEDIIRKGLYYLSK